VLRVLVVEDEAAAAEVMAAYVERVPGFEMAGHAASGGDCLRQLGAGGVDLILLDIHLPDMSGLEVMRRIRAAGSTVDVIVVTQARDLSVVQAAVSFGSMQYLIKPFTFAAVRQKLERYQEYRSMLTENNLMLVQQEVDRLLHTLRDPVESGLPKGINPESLQVVVSALRSRTPSGEASGGMSAAEVASTSGSSRVTARRYLEYLVTSGMVVRSARYRSAGRPEVEYRLVPRGAQEQPFP
jgi:response regulator of citrate/malate metabolism